MYATRAGRRPSSGSPSGALARRALSPLAGGDRNRTTRACAFVFARSRVRHAHAMARPLAAARQLPRQACASSFYLFDRSLLILPLAAAAAATDRPEEPALCLSIYLRPGQVRPGWCVLDHASNNISLDDEGYWDRPDL